jgi:hypothetical protein
VEVEVYYHSLTREQYPKRDKDYREDFVLDPVDVWHANQAAVRLSPSLNWVVRPIIRAAEKIDQAIDGRGYMKIKTATERKRERNVERQTLMEEIESASEEAEKRRQEHGEDA